MSRVIFSFFTTILAISLSQQAAGDEVQHLDSHNSSIAMPEDEFVGVYSECVYYLSYTCLQKKTLRYLIKLESEDYIPVLGKYIAFVKLNSTHNFSDDDELLNQVQDQLMPSPKLSSKIDRKIAEFFNTHVLRIRYGNDSKEDINIGKVVDIVEGRKKNKGEGGGGDSGKKKMMMMAMMCMKMKMMMLIPGMMGMMGMMSLKGILLGGISLLISKVLLIMKLMGGAGGKGGPGGQQGGSDPAWMGGGGGGGAPWNAGGQDSFGSHGGSSGGGGGGGGGGGYNSHGDWQSRSSYDNMQLGMHRRRRQVEIEARKKKPHHAPEEENVGYLDGIKDYFQGLKDSLENNVWD